MKNVDIDNVISMTALQKLSSKRLRRGNIPLYVMDFKSKKKAFVVLDMDTYQRLTQGQGVFNMSVDSFSFRSLGLLWDHPAMTDEEFSKALHDVHHSDHAWALKRLLEYAKSDVATKILSLKELQNATEQVPLRSPYKEAWKNAIQHWTKNPVRLASPSKVGHVYVDSLDDMLANKIGCVVQRNEVKDYLDLYRLIPASHLTAKEIVTLGQKKEGGLDPLIVAHQMGFIFSSQSPEKALLGETDWGDLQLFFKKFQKECLDLIRP